MSDNTFVDRRRKHFQSFLYSLYMRRRRTPHKNRYVDVHEPYLFYLIVGVLLLCSADAIFTTLILQNGGRELNPFMDMLIQKDVILFFLTKFALTTLGVLFFLAHKNFVFFNRIKGSHLLVSCFAVYMSLFVYEIYLLSKIPGSLLV